MAMNKYVRIVVIALTIVAAGFVISWLSDIVAYILIAWVISMLGEPIMQFLLGRFKLSRFKAGRAISAVLTLGVIGTVVFGIGYLFIPVILEQASNLARVDVNALLRTLEEPINALIVKLQAYGVVEYAENPEKQVEAELLKWFQPSKISFFLGSLISFASSIAIGVFSVLFIAFFFLKESGLFTQILSNFFPSRLEDKVQHTVSEVTRLLTRYFGGLVIQVSVITIYLGVALSFLGVKNAILIAFFAALINLIPYLGPIIGGVFGVMLTITSSLDLSFYTEMLPLLTKVMLCFVSLQLIDNFILQPFIFSKQVQAHPLEIFIIIMIGAKLNGILGMVLAIPFYTAIRVIARTFLSEFEVIQKIAIGLNKEQQDSQ
jgi:predicted PurR-regulated permease PerM